MPNQQVNIRSRISKLLRSIALAISAPAAVGGQAVMDGVMMRGAKSWAVAVRRQDGTIAIQHRAYDSFAASHRWARIPLIRGVVALLESLVIGMKALFVSSEYAIEDVERDFSNKDKHKDDVDAEQAERSELDEVERTARLAGVTSGIGVGVSLPTIEEAPEPDPDKLGTVTIVISMIFALGFSILLFKLVPVTLMTLTPINRDSWGFVIGEVLIKFSIFCGYLGVVGFMPDMRRVFQYHSAEHKAINAFERDVEMVPDKVNEMSRIHVRCGTAFIVWLFLIGLFVFRAAQLTFLEGAPIWAVIAARPLLLPVIAGLSFEILRFAGKHADNPALRFVLAPGLWFQRLTTRECRPDQCEVAISSLNAVLDYQKNGVAEDLEDGRVIA